MPKEMTKLDEYGGTVFWAEYSDDELKTAWSTDGQGHEEAVARGPKCHVVKCTEDEAIELSRLFVREVFACPSCCHYDGKTLSLSCGDNGERFWQRALQKTQKLTIKYLRKGRVVRWIRKWVAVLQARKW